MNGRSYLVCATHRSGSQLFCELLRNTRVAGWPAEYYLPRAEATRYAEESRWAQPEALRLDSGYLARLLRTRVTRNGVFGLNVMRSYFDEFVDWLAEVRPDVATRPPVARLATVFGDPAYVHLTRCDKVRQAVSLIRARDTGAYQRHHAETQPFTREFDAELVARTVADLEAQDAGWHAFFATSGVTPVPVVYEDLVESPNEILADVLTRLGVDPPAGGGAAPRTQKQADERSEEWVTRYREGRG